MYIYTLFNFNMHVRLQAPAPPLRGLRYIPMQHTRVFDPTHLDASIVRTSRYQQLYVALDMDTDLVECLT